MGHGSGKLLIKDINTGTFNFDTEMINPLTNQKVSTYYLSNETYASKFGKL